MTEEFAKAVALLKDAKYIGLVFGSGKPSVDALVSAQALLRVFTGQHKMFGLLVQPAVSGRENAELLKAFAHPPILLKEFIISLDTSAAPVSQLRYEKAEGRIDVIFSPDSTPIHAEQVSFHDGGVRCDVAILLGIPPGESPVIPGIEPAFLAHIPMITFDLDGESKRFGAIQISDPQVASFSEMTCVLIKELTGQMPDGQSATLLLAGVLDQTRGFGSPDILPNRFAAAADLLRAGADYRHALRIARQTLPIELLRLIGRALVRSREDAAGSVFWSFLNADDFQITGMGAEQVYTVLETIAGEFPRQETHVFLWQPAPDSGISALIRSNPNILERVQTVSGGEMQGKQLLAVSGQFKDFEEAEQKIGSLLRTVV